MIKIQDIEFDNGEVIISVGFFLAPDFSLLKLSNPKYVENYEPLYSAFVHHVKATKNIPAVQNIQKAVSNENGECFLLERGTKSSISLEDGKKVATVSMESVINNAYKKFGRIDKLLMNCEGSEIPIIDENPLKLFLRCDKIFIQFHNFLPSLGVTNEDMYRCLAKLGRCFDYRLLSSYKYSKYLFMRYL